MALVLTVVALVLAPLLVIAGAMLSCLATRWSVARSPGSFRCKVGVIKPPLTSMRWAWPRQTARAVWVHDALVVVTGVLRAHVRSLAVHFAEGDLQRAAPDVGGGLGHRPLMLTLRLDDGSRALVVAPYEARSVMAGPYLVAQLAATRPPRRNDSTAESPTPDLP